MVQRDDVAAAQPPALVGGIDGVGRRARLLIPLSAGDVRNRHEGYVVQRRVRVSVGADSYAVAAVGGGAAPAAFIPVAALASLRPPRLLRSAVFIPAFLTQPTRVVAAAVARAKGPCRLP